MFARLGHLAVRRKMLVVVASAIIVGIAAGLGSLVFARLSSGGYSEDRQKEHAAIVDALRARSPELAGRAMRAHLDAAGRTLLAHVPDVARTR